MTFDNTRASTNLGFDLFNPYDQSTLTVQVTQPLLNGFGKTVNERYIIEAKNTVKVGESQFAQQVMTTITQVAHDYWELVYARENVKVEQVAVAADQQLYENNKKQLEIGTMAPLDVITAQSQLATDQQALVQAQTTQLLDETTLLRPSRRIRWRRNSQGIEIVPTTSDFHSDAREYFARRRRKRGVAEEAGAAAGRAEPEECGRRGEGDQEPAAAPSELVRSV